jgi:hypothetical protein
VASPIDPLEPPTGTAALTARVKPGVGVETGFTIESAGPVDGAGSEITIPLRLVDEASGRRVEIAVRIAIDS